MNEGIVEQLRNAMKGLGTDEDALINIVGNTNNYDRQQLKKFFKSSYGEDLIQEIDSEISGDFQKVNDGVIHGSY